MKTTTKIQLIGKFIVNGPVQLIECTEKIGFQKLTETSEKKETSEKIKRISTDSRAKADLPSHWKTNIKRVALNTNIPWQLNAKKYCGGSGGKTAR